MRLPNADRAVIEPAKLRDYLLSPTHSVGRFKATLFAVLGYTQEEWRRLEADLRSQHLTKEAQLVATSRYGQKYEIRAALIGPAGRSAQVVSSWVVLAGDDVPRFVTAYPGGKL